MQKYKIKYLTWQNREPNNNQGIGTCQTVENATQSEIRTIKGSTEKQNIFSTFHLPFTRKKPGLMEKLAGELDAGQVLTYLCEITFTIALTVGACKGAQSLTGRALGL